MKALRVKHELTTLLYNNMEMFITHSSIGTVSTFGVSLVQLFAKVHNKKVEFSKSA